MGRSFQHIILTRFNCRFEAAWTNVALDPEWLGPRFELFDRYCLPSVREQTCSEFQWVIFFDAETPEPFRSRAELLRDARTHVIFVKTLSGDLIRETIRTLSSDVSQLITTRLDNDDGLALDAVSRLQENLRDSPDRYYLNVEEGLILSGKRLYLRRDRHNAFVSLVEPTGDSVEGVTSRRHTEIGFHAPVYQVGGGPGWLQVVHGENVSNKIRGLRIHPSRVDRSRFSDRVDWPGSDYAVTRVFENALLQPVRMVRDKAAEWRRNLLLRRR
jgi:hypothetical protein